MSTSPVAVSTDDHVSCGAVLWRYQGRLLLTVIVKATFSMVPEGVAAAVSPRAIAAADRPFDGHPSRSLEIASDRALYLARCDVTFVGHAHAPGGRPAPTSSVRLGLFRDARPLLDKALHVYGARRGGAPEPFTQMPLVYERAFGGLGEANPVGVETPNVVDPADPRRPVGFAPISPYWPARKRLLGSIDRRALEGAVAEVPEGIAWDYFQAAPPDQQIEYLRGGEWLVFDGMHPTLSRVQTRLPTARGVARVLVQRPGAAPAEQAVELACDTLAIDGDKQMISLVWRGRYEVVGGEAALPSLTVLAALETPGAAVEWARLARSEAAPASITGAVVAPAEETLALRPEQAAAVAQRAIAPFAVAPVGSRAEPASTAATPWSTEPMRPTAAAGEGTMALRDEQQAALAQQPIAPFQVTSPGAGGASAAVAGAPWSGVAAAAIPRPSAGEETMALGGQAKAPPPPPVMFTMPADIAPPPEAAPVSRPAPKAPPLAGPESIAEKLRAAGANPADVAAILQALRPSIPGKE